MKVELVLSTPESQIGENAKICYATKSLEDGGKDITHTMVHKRGHLSALRFAYATIQIEGLSVPAHVQILRSGSHLDYMVRSLRYVNINKDGSQFVLPKGLTMAQEELMLKVWEKTVTAYNELLDQGVPKEDARAVLCTNVATRMSVTGNLQAWHDFFKLRVNSHAQREVRGIAIQIWGLLIKAYPNVFTDMIYEGKTYAEWLADEEI